MQIGTPCFSMQPASSRGQQLGAARTRSSLQPAVRRGRTPKLPTRPARCGQALLPPPTLPSLCPSPVMAAATSATAPECMPTWLPTAWGSSRARCRRTGRCTSQTPAPEPGNASSSGEGRHPGEHVRTAPAAWRPGIQRRVRTLLLHWAAPSACNCWTSRLVKAWRLSGGLTAVSRLPPVDAATRALSRPLPHRRPSEGLEHCLSNERLAWPGHQPDFLRV